MTMVAVVPESPDRVVREVAPPTDATNYWDQSISLTYPSRDLVPSNKIRDTL